jgi:hypothetical protein
LAQAVTLLTSIKKVCLHFALRSDHPGVEIAQSVQRRATARVRFLVVQNFSLLHSLNTDSGGPPSLLSSGLEGVLSLGLKRQGREADHSHPSSQGQKVEL